VLALLRILRTDLPHAQARTYLLPPTVEDSAKVELILDEMPLKYSGMPLRKQ
jgi:hypothetical protein